MFDLFVKYYNEYILCVFVCYLHCIHFFIAKFLVIVGSSFTVVNAFLVNNDSLGEINCASKTIRKLFKLLENYS